MNERRLRRALQNAPVPDERQRQERSWRVLAAAFEERQIATPRRSRKARVLVALAAGAAILGLALSPAGAKVSDLIKSVVSPGEKNAAPALRRLPGGGRLLVNSVKGPWVVQPDGSRRLLGAYEEASWSPHGLYVAAARGRQLSAVDPLGAVRWSVTAPARVRDQRWAPSGVRIAYLSGSALRIVAAIGTEDRVLKRHVAAVAPAWRPLRRPLPAGQTVATGPGTNVLAYVGSNGTVRVLDTDSGALLWSYKPRERPLQLAWLPHGRGLAVLGSSSLVVLDANGKPSGRTHRFSPDPRGELAISPTDGRIAEVRHLHGASRSELVLVNSNGGAQKLFSGPGRFGDIAWSPGGAWLALSWPAADQWLFLQPAHPHRIVAVANIARQFDPSASKRPPSPRIGGWCCAP